MNEYEEYKKLMGKLNLSDFFESSRRCPTCMLRGEPRMCLKCGRAVCTSCLSLDNVDCIACGPGGELFLELKDRLEKGTE